MDTKFFVMWCIAALGSILISLATLALIGIGIMAGCKYMGWL